MKRVSSVVAVVAALLGSAGAARAAPITEVEPNNTIAGAQLIPASAFTPAPATVFNPPGYPTATVSGLGGNADVSPGVFGFDVDFYAFTANGGNVYFDVDDNPFTFDPVLSLFDSTGTLIASDDDSFPEDPGTEFGFDSFLGVFTLPGPGTYYLAVSAFPNLPSALLSATLINSLSRPDGVCDVTTGSFCGGRVLNATRGDSSFVNPVNRNGTQPYTLHISVQNPAAPTVPEPATLVLFGAGLTIAAVRLRRRRR